MHRLHGYSDHCWTYTVCPTNGYPLGKVSRDTLDTLSRGIHGLVILCMSNVCKMYVRVSMESTDTLSRGCPGLAILRMSNVGEYNMGTLSRGISGLTILCISNVHQSIHGLSKWYPWIGYYVYPMVVRV